VTVVIRAATRSSPLARWQTDHVAQLLAAVDRTIVVEPVVVSTEGDRRTDVPIHAMGGKGVFSKEVQDAVLDGRADIAVHSAKDLPGITLPGLRLAAVPERADPRDALVGASLDGLAVGATVATGSVRRRAQLLRIRPDLVIVELRGNIHTRLSRVGEVAAIVMAAAPLDRLGLDRDDAHRLDTTVMLPQVGQGALAVECRFDDSLADLVAEIEHAPTRWAVDGERAFLAELGGDCDLPAAAHAIVDGVDIALTGFLATAADPYTESGTDPEAIGRSVARHLAAS
jgi:hydroxymethylbilane synthase